MDVDNEPKELEYPYFADVPRVPEENREYRGKLLARCRDNEAHRRSVYKMCADDSLFWLSSFCDLFEPRPRPQILPFIPWDHQIPVWKEMERWLGYRDVGLMKSRAEGASWLICMLVLHKWLFMPMFAAGLVSKDERSVDDPDNPDSLFWKLTWMLQRLPSWMRPRFGRSKTTHMLNNLRSGATITGYAATGDAGRGGRKTIFIMDELASFPRGPDYDVMASTQYISDCRYLISTPKGPEGAYFDAMVGDGDLVKLTLHWKKNPVRSLGAYKVKIARDNTRKVELIDLPYWRDKVRENGRECDSTGEVLRLADAIEPERENAFGYEFMMTGPFVKHDQTRSPWYDLQCRRPGVTPASIAQELDCDFGGSSSRFFDINMLVRLQSACQDPLCEGEMVIPKNVDSYLDLQKPKFQKQYGGRLLLWFVPDMYGNVPHGRNYIIGADISAGGGGVSTSNSALAVIDRVTGRQVAMLASPQIPPHELADYAVAMAYWFDGGSGPAQIIWEANGPNGSQFTQRIASIAYNNVYYRGQPEEMVERESSKIGFWTTPKTKPALLGEMARALNTGELECMCRECLEEAKFYVNLLGGKIEHISASTEKDPSGAGERHGDRVIALALAWWVVKDYVLDGKVADSIEADIPANCALGRRRLAKRNESGPPAWVPPSQVRNRSKMPGGIGKWTRR